ncbi:hypothetical protein [Rubritalea squalenifaciens]|nr:hypothetical protein [Rubritalea squalenifaciens]
MKYQAAMKDLLFTLVLSLLLCGYGGAEVGRSAEWKSHSLKLDDEGDYRCLFESGMRVYRSPSLETNLLEAKHVRLEIAGVVDGREIAVPVELLHANVYSGGKLERIELISSQLTLAEARELALGYQSLGTFKEEDLQNHLDRVHGAHVSGAELEGREAVFSLFYQGGREHFISRCWLEYHRSQTMPLQLKWEFSWRKLRSHQEKQLYRGPIPPPAGFEHVDMEAGDDFGPDSVAAPASGRAHPDGSQDLAMKPDKGRPAWMYVAGGLLLLVGALVLFLCGVGRKKE